MKPVLKLMGDSFDLDADITPYVSYAKWPHFTRWAIADNPEEFCRAWQAVATVAAPAIREELEA